MADDDSKKSSALEDDDHEDFFYDPLDEFAFTDEDLRNVMSSPNPSLMDLNLTPLDPPPITSYMEINETQLMNELSLSITDCNIDDDFLLSWEEMDEPPSNADLVDLNVPEDNGNDHNSGITIVGGETTTTRLEVSTRVLGNTNGPNFEIGCPSTMPVPVTPIISDGSLVCTCCTLLRELVHTNGPNGSRLTIYGGIGFFCHAILETERYVGFRYQTFHLKDLAMETVKKFIEEYCFQIQSQGLSLVEDTNSSFYQAMNANSISNQTLMVPIPSLNDVPMSLPTPNDVLNVPQPVPPQDEPTSTSSKKGKGKKKEKRKSALALQRERTGKMTLKDINMHFHLPIETAARIMRLCPTVLKKICRKGGLMRWPHRKLKSMEDKIERLENVVRTSKNVGVRTRAQQDIEMLRKKIAEICSDILKNF